MADLFIIVYPLSFIPQIHFIKHHARIRPLALPNTLRDKSGPIMRHNKICYYLGIKANKFKATTFYHEDRCELATAVGGIGTGSE
jgi:hypothetical protein